MGIVHFTIFTVSIQSVKNMNDGSMKPHFWEYCDLCLHEVVICGKCGNNTCNGGYGIVDGKECDACPSAYEMYQIGKKDE